jgi:hypothetical protein
MADYAKKLRDEIKTKGPPKKRDSEGSHRELSSREKAIEFAKGVKKPKLKPIVQDGE